MKIYLSLLVGRKEPLVVVLHGLGIHELIVNFEMIDLVIMFDLQILKAIKFPRQEGLAVRMSMLKKFYALVKFH